MPTLFTNDLRVLNIPYAYNGIFLYVLTRSSIGF
nr:MAG TPA: hypothetical protein [Caudoviricetes sp.]